MKFADLLKQNTSSTTTATLTLTSAVAGFRTLTQAIAENELAVGDKTTFMVRDTLGNWEFSLFEIVSAGTLTRVEVRGSSNAGSAETFPSGAVATNMPDSKWLSELVSAADAVEVTDLPALTSIADAVRFIAIDTAGGLCTVTAAVQKVYNGGSATPDTTGPTLSGPTGASTGTTTYSGSVTTNEANGTLRYLATVNATETAATIKASGASLAITSTGSKAVTGSGLNASTQYRPHFLHTDAAGNDSNVVTSAPFTTASPGDTTAPTLSSPSATKTGSTTASGTVSTNEANGTLYRYASTNAVETAATVKAANLTQNVTATGVQNASFTGLPSGATLYPHYVHRDAAGNDSAVASGAAFVTDSGNTAPAAPTIGTLTAGDGTVSQAFTPGSNGGSPVTAFTLTVYRVSDNTVVTTATGASSPISATVANGLAVYGKVTADNNVGTSPESAASNSVTPAVLVDFNITPYNSGSINSTKSYSAMPGPSSPKYLVPGPGSNGNGYSTTLYWNVNGPTPTKVYMGWGDSATEPPPIIASNQTTQNAINGMTEMTKAAGDAWAMTSFLWVTAPGVKYPWIQPELNGVKGKPELLLAGGMTITA